METISLNDAKTRLSELIDRVQDGGSIVITRRGKPVARLLATSEPRKRVDWSLLHSLTASMPACTDRTVEQNQSMRDGDRY